MVVGVLTLIAHSLLAASSPKLRAPGLGFAAQLRAAREAKTHTALRGAMTASAQRSAYLSAAIDVAPSYHLSPAPATVKINGLDAPGLGFAAKLRAAREAKLATSPSMGQLTTLPIAAPHVVRTAEENALAADLKNAALLLGVHLDHAIADSESISEGGKAHAFQLYRSNRTPEDEATLAKTQSLIRNALEGSKIDATANAARVASLPLAGRDEQERSTLATTQALIRGVLGGNHQQPNERDGASHLLDPFPVRASAPRSTSASGASEVPPAASWKAVSERGHAERIAALEKRLIDAVMSGDGASVARLKSELERLKERNDHTEVHTIEAELDDLAAAPVSGGGGSESDGVRGAWAGDAESAIQEEEDAESTFQVDDTVDDSTFNDDNVDAEMLAAATAEADAYMDALDDTTSDGNELSDGDEWGALFSGVGFKKDAGELLTSAPDVDEEGGDFEVMEGTVASRNAERTLGVMDKLMNRQSGERASSEELLKLLRSTEGSTERS